MTGLFRWERKKKSEVQRSCARTTSKKRTEKKKNDYNDKKARPTGCDTRKVRRRVHARRRTSAEDHRGGDACRCELLPEECILYKRRRVTYGASVPKTSGMKRRSRARSNTRTRTHGATHARASHIKRTRATGRAHAHRCRRRAATAQPWWGGPVARDRRARPVSAAADERLAAHPPERLFGLLFTYSLLLFIYYIIIIIIIIVVIVVYRCYYYYTVGLYYYCLLLYFATIDRRARKYATGIKAKRKYLARPQITTIL